MKGPSIKKASPKLKSAGRLKPVNPKKSVNADMLKALRTPMGPSQATIPLGGAGIPQFAKGGLVKGKKGKGKR